MSYPQGPLQGHVYYEEPLQGGVVYNENAFMRILRGVGGVLKDVGGRVAEHAPEILQGVATGLAMSQLGRSAGNQVDYTNNLDYGTRQSSYSPMTIPTVRPIPMREIPQYKPSTLGRDALRQVESLRQAYEPPRYTPPSNPLSSLLNQSNVTPTHQSRPSVQQTPSADWRSGYQNQSSGMLARALDPNFGRGASSPVQEDWTQVQHHLSHASRPITQAEINAMRQQQALQAQQQQAINAQLQSAQAQREQYEAQTRALREQQHREYQARQNFGFQGWKAAPMKMPPSLIETPEFQDKANELRHMAEQIKGGTKENKPCQIVDDVDAISCLMSRAAKLSNNEPEVFIRLMNEVLIGNINKWGYAPGIPPRIPGNTRIEFGDKGMHPLYQDHSPMQMYHFWSYVNYGYYYPTDIAKAGNTVHEVVEPIIRKELDQHGIPSSRIPFIRSLSESGSAEDYRLSAVGYNIGKALKKGHIKPSKLHDMLDQVLRTDKYNVTPEEDPWLQRLRKTDP